MIMHAAAAVEVVPHRLQDTWQHYRGAEGVGHAEADAVEGHGAAAAAGIAALQSRCLLCCMKQLCRASHGIQAHQMSVAQIASEHAHKDALMHL